jgi:hypothetical protein
VTPYLLGLLTLPAIVGVAAALYGLARAVGWLLNRTVLRLQPAENAKVAARFAGFVASTARAVTVLRITRLVEIAIVIGPIDHDKADRITRAVHAELGTANPAPRLRIKAEEPR